MQEFEKLKLNKTVYLFGVARDWVQQRFIRDPNMGKVVDFLVVCFASKHPEIDSLFFQSTPPQQYRFYSVSESYVDPFVNLKDYYDLLDSVADAMEREGYRVLKILKKPSLFSPEFLELGVDVYSDLGIPQFKMFLEKPHFVESFVEATAEYTPDDYSPLDSFPESWRTTAWRHFNQWDQ